MNDILRALGISSGILLSVVVLIVIVSMAAVKRGEANVKAVHEGRDEPSPVRETAAAVPAARAGKDMGPVVEEVSVPVIFLLGIALFALTLLGLMGLSLLEHLN